MGKKFGQLLQFATITAVLIVTSRKVQKEESHDREFETWLEVSRTPPPPPSVFATWRRGYGADAVDQAIRDVAEYNPLTVRLVNRVLYLRAQHAYITAFDAHERMRIAA